MSFIYTRSQLKDRVNAGIHGKKDMLISFDDLINDAIREVISEVDLRSNKRQAELQTNLFDNVFQYASPADLSVNKIIDIRTQAEKDSCKSKLPYFLVPTEEFYRKKFDTDKMIALDNKNGVQQLLISSNVDNQVKIISTLDNLNAGGGTWEAFGDGSNLRQDSDDYVKGAGSIRWDINSDGNTTAGIYNDGLNSFDLDDDYLGGNGALFVWVYINSKTDITNFTMRLGSSNSAYHQKAVTTRHDGTAFVNGWNLVRFDLTSMTDTGTPDDDAITYCAIYMTKAVGKISETDYRFDSLILRKGEINNIFYYSKFGWQTSVGVYIRNSTDDSDILVAEDDEYKLFKLKAISLASDEINEYDVSIKKANDYSDAKNIYVRDNFSEAMIMTNEYYKYEDPYNK